MTELEARELINATALMVAIPTHDQRVDVATLRGVTELAHLWGDGMALGTHDGFLPRSRDTITAVFARSHCSHLLCVDSDMGFGAGHVLRLLSHGVDVVSGVYARRTGAAGELVAKELELGARTQRGALRAVRTAGAGFLLLTRGAVERMCLEYARDSYGGVQALWMPRTTPDGQYEQEDEAFASRWRALGETVWLDTECVVEHYGRSIFVPR